MVRSAPFTPASLPQDKPFGITSFADPHRLTPIESQIYEKHRGVGCLFRLGARTRHTCHHHSACKPFFINRLRTLSIINRGGGLRAHLSFKFHFNFLPRASRFASTLGTPNTARGSRTTSP